MYETQSEKKKIKTLLSTKSVYELHLEEYYALKSTKQKQKTVKLVDSSAYYSQTYLDPKKVAKTDLTTYRMKIPIDHLAPFPKKDYLVIYGFNKMEDKKLYFKINGFIPLFTHLKGELYGTNFELIYRDVQKNLKLTFKVFYKNCSNKKIRTLRALLKNYVQESLKEENTDRPDFWAHMGQKILSRSYQKELFNKMVSHTGAIKNIHLVKAVPLNSNL